MQGSCKPRPHCTSEGHTASPRPSRCQLFQERTWIGHTVQATGNSKLWTGKKLAAHVCLTRCDFRSEITIETALATHVAVFAPQGPPCGRPRPYQMSGQSTHNAIEQPTGLRLKYFKGFRFNSTHKLGISWLWKFYLILIFAALRGADHFYCVFFPLILRAQKPISGHKWLLFLPICYPRALLIGQAPEHRVMIELRWKVANGCAPSSLSRLLLPLILCLEISLP